MLTLVLTRHGVTDRSKPEQHLGQRIDISINDTGRRQAKALAQRLARVPFDHAFTSPLFRARETADILVGPGWATADPRLREMDYGAWEGRTYAEVNELDGAYRRAWEAAPDRLPCPGGESGDDVAARVRSFLDDLLDEHRTWSARASLRAATSGGGTPPVTPDRPVLAVAHSTTNRILLSVALRLPISEFRHRFIQGQANMTVLRWELDAQPDEAQLIVMNDLGHLLPADADPWE